MISKKRVLKTIAKNYKMDPDEILISLWNSFENKFKYLNSEEDVVKDKDYKYVRRLVESKFKKENPIGKNEIIVKPVVVEKELDFSLIGRLVSHMNYLNKEEVLKIYKELVADFDTQEDPIQPSGVRDEDLLDSAIFHGQTSYENYIKYPTVESAAAALMYAISQNHAFHNGNKRTAMVSMLVFLERHHTILTCNEDDLFKISFDLANHKLVSPENLYTDAEIYSLARWINANSKVIKKGDRPITLKKLKQILGDFDCEILENNRVQRTAWSTNFLGYKKKKTLISKRTIGNTISDGQEVDRGLIKSLREDLELNPENSIDSEAFYERAIFTSSDFINKYKNLLKRLSKV